jgi:hypothetical protein
MLTSHRISSASVHFYFGPNFVPSFCSTSPVFPYASKRRSTFERKLVYNSWFRLAGISVVRHLKMVVRPKHVADNLNKIVNNIETEICVRRKSLNPMLSYLFLYSLLIHFFLHSASKRFLRLVFNLPQPTGLFFQRMEELNITHVYINRRLFVNVKWMYMIIICMCDSIYIYIYIYVYTSSCLSYCSYFREMEVGWQDHHYVWLCAFSYYVLNVLTNPHHIWHVYNDTWTRWGEVRLLYDWRSVSMSQYQAPLWSLRPDITSLLIQIVNKNKKWIQ